MIRAMRHRSRPKKRACNRAARRFAFAAVALALVPGCADTSQTPKTTSPQVGGQLVNPAEAGVLFAHACIKTRPDFRGMPNALVGQPWVQNSATSTYFHQKQNLSLKVHGAECSMVFAAPDGDESVVERLATGTAVALKQPAPPGITLTSRVEADGLRYYRMGIKG